MWIRSWVRSLRLYSSKVEQFEVKKIHKAEGTFGPLTAVNPEDRTFQLSSGGGKGDPNPLVIIFGWAGATHKVGPPPLSVLSN